jgi:hypothetical protein
MPDDNLRKEGMSFIGCECCFEILLVPVLKIMKKVIEMQAIQHVEKEKDPAKAVSKKERIELALIAQILNKAASS